MQIFLLFFIDGARYIEEADLHWEFITVYRRQRTETGGNMYHFVGYVTYYPFFHFPDKIRYRISQFFVLPPYQRQGHGSRMYRFLFELFLNRPDVYDFGVEDPNDAFTDMRDAHDVNHVLASGFFDPILPPMSPEKMEELHSTFKFSQRQCKRVAEMALLKVIRGQGAEVLKRYRLQVKRRIFLQNKEVLMEMEPEEQIKTLDKTYKLVYEDYKGLIARLN